MRTLSRFALLALLLSGCAERNPVGPPVRSEISSYSTSGTFLIESSDDRRLPAPGAEATAATARDRATFQRMLAGASAASVAASPAIVWNRLTTELGRGAALPPPKMARAYALVQVALYDALVASGDGRRGGLPGRAAGAGAASEVLAYLFPGSLDRIEAVAADEVAQVGTTGAAFGAWSLGRAVGRLAVQRGSKDGSDEVFTGTPPTGEGIWTGTNPVLPMCGEWTTWVLHEGSEIDVEAPYAFGSEADLREVQEVLDFSLGRTSEQIEIVHKWGDRSPPTIWNEILNARIESAGLEDVAAARAHAYLNVAMVDGFICCWKTKYRYWTARPIQRIPGLVTVIPTPNFPSYTSGHSTISAAAAVVLGAIFPAERDYFIGQAHEAAMSRLYGGIHFRHDNEQGTVAGLRVGERVVERMRSRERLHLALAGSRE